MEQLLIFEQNIFNFINRDLTNPVFDVFFPFWTDIQKNLVFQFVFIPLLLFFFVRKKNWTAIKVIVIAAIGSAIANNFNHNVIKELILRPRPIGAIYRIELPHSSSFPSGHAVNAFALWTIFALFYPRYKYAFLTLAFLTAFSRVYCGVHYPGDVLVGAIVGMIFGVIIYKLVRIKKFNLQFALIFFLSSSSAFAEWNDPTEGKPFFKWAWEDELKPTFKRSVDSTGLTILGVGAGSTLVVRQYDHKIYDDNKKHPYLFTEHEANTLGRLGDGGLGIGIAAVQTYFDQRNGINHFKAILLTSTTHASMAAIVRRKRPDKSNDFLPYPSSFPSGHSSSAFATAGALAYSYGWVAGVPAYAVASAISIARIRNARHWSSDIVAGAIIGSYWARASFHDDKKDDESISVFPSPVGDGLMVTGVMNF